MTVDQLVIAVDSNGGRLNAAGLHGWSFRWSFVPKSTRAARYGSSLYGGCAFVLPQVANTLHVMSWRGIVCAALLCVGACGKRDTGFVMEAAHFTTPDLSTPDRALRTYWAMQDSNEASGIRNGERFNEIPSQVATRKALASIYFGPALAEAVTVQKSSASTYLREIIEVKNESDTRATVTARIRNATPIPPGAVVTDYDAKARQEGEVFRYVLERDSAGWKIAQIYSKSFGSEEWNPRFKPGSVLVGTYVTP